MQTLAAGPCIHKAQSLDQCPWRQTLRLRAFSSSSDYSNQSRGGIPRFFSRVLPSSKGVGVRVQDDEFWHMTKVLRLNVNDRVELFDGKGGLVQGCIQTIDRKGLDFVALEEPKLVLPLENRLDRLKRVTVAATKQCQRLHEMTLNPPAKLRTILPVVSQSQLFFVAIAEATPVINVLTSSTAESGAMIVGPEGDFTKEEIRMMMDAGATAVGLGPHRLRVETATVALLGTLMLWSDCKSAT